MRSEVAKCFKYKKQLIVNSLLIDTINQNSSETKYQAVTTNPFVLTFLERFECSCTHFQAVIFSVNPQKSARLSR